MSTLRIGGWVYLRKGLCGTFFAGASLIGCGQATNLSELSNTEDFSTIAAKPGEGFDSLHVRLTDNTCLESERSEQQVSAIEGFVEKVEDLNQIKAKLGFGFDGEFSYALATGSAKANMLAESESTSRSMSFVVYRKVISKIIRAMNPVLKNEFNQANCGDKYVNSVAMGAEISVLVKLVFSSQKMKSEFEVGGSANFTTLGSLKTMVSVMNEKLKENTSIVIRRISTGENLETLGGIFSGQDYITCSVKNFTACEKVLSSLVDYMEGPFNQAALKSSTVIDFDLRDYSVSGLTSLSDEVLEKRESLARAREDFSRDHTRTEDLLKSTLLSQDHRKELLKVRSMLTQNIERANRNLLKCFQHPENCSSNPTYLEINRDLFGPVKKSIEKTLSAKLNGSVDCANNVERELQKMCSAAAKSSPGEVLSTKIRNSGIKEDFRGYNLFSGSYCRSARKDAVCLIEFLL